MSRCSRQFVHGFIFFMLGISGCSPLPTNRAWDELRSDSGRGTDTYAFLSGDRVRTGSDASAQQPPPKPTPAETRAKDSASGSKKKRVAVTEFSTIQDAWNHTEKQGQPPTLATAASPTMVSEEFSDTYTRLIIVGTIFQPNNKDGAEGSADAQADEFLPYEPRGPIVRYFFGRNFTTNFTAKVTVGTFETTVPLATITHRSDRGGEHWSRSVHYNSYNFPLFLVRSDGAASIPSITFTLSASNELTSQGAAAGLQAALSVARATGATASVITRLSEQETKERARAIDDVVSRLFSNGIQEEHLTDRDLRMWKSDHGKPVGVTANFLLPKEEGKWKSELREVGSWVFTFDFPRRSIFSDWRICGDVKLPKCTTSRAESDDRIWAGLDPSSVLNYRLLNTSLGSIRTYLSQQDWYLSAVNGMSSAAPTTRTSAANNMCRRIRNEITSLGLSAFDADIVLWAVWKSMPLPDNKPDPKKMDDCKLPIIMIDSKRPNLSS